MLNTVQNFNPIIIRNSDTMKKQLSYLIAAVCLLVANKAFADPGVMLPAQVQAEMGGYNPGAYNTTEL